MRFSTLTTIATLSPQFSLSFASPGYQRSNKGRSVPSSVRRGVNTPDTLMVSLKPLPSGELIEVLWWCRDAWGHAGPFGAILPLDDALAFIADEPAFWIRA